jgi:hypothetical protein
MPLRIKIMGEWIRLIEILFGGIVALYVGYLQFGKKDKGIIKLRIENEELRKQKYILLNQKKNVQDAFKIVFEQYEKEWLKDPQQMGMLKGIKELIDE